MNRQVCLFFILLGIIHLSKGLTISQDFDVIIFSQSWPITTCLSWKEKSTMNKCNLPNHGNWTVHGVWPSKYGKNGPNWCKNNTSFKSEELNSIRKDLEVKWPDIHMTKYPESFWKHEWEKHGTCGNSLESINTPLKYFQIGILLHDQFNIKDILRTENIFPGQDYHVQQILDALQNILGVLTKITCYTDSKKTQHLLDIRICFDKKLNVINCDDTSGFTTNCKSNNVNYLKKMPSM